MRIEYEPIGVIHTPHATPSGMPKNTADAAGIRGTVALDARHAPGLADLEGFTHVFLVFHCHEVRGHEPAVVPPGGHEPRGLFATRSPRRPNPIGLSVVRLDGIEGNLLRVRDVDMVDGTPLLDIKPYLPSVDAHPDAGTGWLGRGGGRGPAE